MAGIEAIHGIELKHGKFYEAGRGQFLTKAYVLEALHQLEQQLVERDEELRVMALRLNRSGRDLAGGSSEREEAQRSSYTVKEICGFTCAVGLGGMLFHIAGCENGQVDTWEEE